MATLIPFSFLNLYAGLDWREVLWGYEHQLIGWPTVVDIATEHIRAGSDDSKELQLASLTKMEAHQVGSLLRDLVSASPKVNESEPKTVWMDLLLAWLFVNKASITDPLAEIEKIYADFDYPQEIEGFVRYMPPTDTYDPRVHSNKENEARLFGKWQDYLVTRFADFS